MTSLFEYQATKTERMAATLAHFVSTTAPDRVDWTPATEEASQTRSIMAMLTECIGVNFYTAALLRGEAPAAPGRGAPPITYSDTADALRQLVDSAEMLAAAIRGLDESALTRTFPHWRGPIIGTTMIELAYRNMVYHAGQVNMVQLLAGDTEFHVPPTWF
jgi:hypothetical protein